MEDHDTQLLPNLGAMNVNFTVEEGGETVCPPPYALTTRRRHRTPGGGTARCGLNDVNYSPVVAPKLVD